MHEWQVWGKPYSIKEAKHKQYDVAWTSTLTAFDYTKLFVTRYVWLWSKPLIVFSCSKFEQNLILCICGARYGSKSIHPLSHTKMGECMNGRFNCRPLLVRGDHGVRPEPRRWRHGHRHRHRHRRFQGRHRSSWSWSFSASFRLLTTTDFLSQGSEAARNYHSFHRQNSERTINYLWTLLSLIFPCSCWGRFIFLYALPVISKPENGAQLCWFWLLCWSKLPASGKRWFLAHSFEVRGGAVPSQRVSSPRGWILPKMNCSCRLPTRGGIHRPWFELLPKCWAFWPNWETGRSDPGWDPTPLVKMLGHAVEFSQKTRVFHRACGVSPHRERPLHRVCEIRCDARAARDQPPTRTAHRRTMPKVTGAVTCWGCGIVKSSRVYGRAVVRTRSFDSTIPHLSTVPKVRDDRIIA